MGCQHGGLASKSRARRQPRGAQSQASQAFQVGRYLPALAGKGPEASEHNQTRTHVGFYRRRRATRMVARSGSIARIASVQLGRYLGAHGRRGEIGVWVKRESSVSQTETVRKSTFGSRRVSRVGLKPKTAQIEFFR